jgi:hypothetical protein
MQLRELEIGDIFIAESDKGFFRKKFTVRNNCIYNARHGSATRNCYLSNGEIVSKSANLEVIKIGESKHKEKLQQLFGKPKQRQPLERHSHESRNLIII